MLSFRVALCALLASGFVACASGAPPKSAADDTAPSDTAPGDTAPSDTRAPETQGEDAPSEPTDGAGASATDRASSPADDAGSAQGATSETRTMGVIQDIVKGHRAEVRECFDKVLKDRPGLKGDLVVHFTIDPKGKVKSANINVERSTLAVPELSTCAIEVIQKITFPPSSRGFESTVNYPFNLNP